jgi:hypothetical protein
MLLGGRLRVVDVRLFRFREMELMRVEDQLLMRFTLIDPTNPEREFMIVIDISKQDYAGRLLVCARE